MMSEAEAIQSLKIECKLLADVFTDEELLYFLNKYKTDAEYNIRKSIYDALTSALSVEAQYESRGGISVNRIDLIKVRNMYAQVSVVKLIRD